MATVCVQIGQSSSLFSKGTDRFSKWNCASCDGMSSAEIREAMEIKYRENHAAILEADGKYLIASKNYLTISLCDVDRINRVSKSLGKAIKCAIFAKASRQRDQMIERLILDTRTENFLSFKLLKYMHQHRIISKEDQEEFKWTVSRGDWPFLQHAVCEHNLRSMARIYKNIRIKDAAMMLGISMEMTEDLARTMMIENRLKGTIDQIDCEITFYDDDDNLRSFDCEIKQTLLELNSVVEMIKERNRSFK